MTSPSRSTRVIACLEEAVHNYKKGDEINAIVLAVDPERERISLGVKQIDRDPFGQWVADHPRGSIVTGKVKELEQRHAVIELDEGVEGILRSSEIDRERVEDVRTRFKLGDEVEAKFVGQDRKSRMLSLSIKAKDYAEESEAMQEYNQQEAEVSAPTTLGDLLKDQLGDLNSFSLHFRGARMGRNPKSGDAVALRGKYVPHFKPGKELRERVNVLAGDGKVRTSDDADDGDFNDATGGVSLRPIGTTQRTFIEACQTFSMIAMRLMRTSLTRSAVTCKTALMI